MTNIDDLLKATLRYYMDVFTDFFEVKKEHMPWKGLWGQELQQHKEVIEDAKKKVSGTEDNNKNLKSIFSDVTLNGKVNVFYHSICKLDLSPNIFPKKEGEEENEDLIKDFSEEYNKLKEKHPFTLYYLLKKYAFFLPYNGISLFTHMKLTLAIASCIESKEIKPYLFVYGDFSGIQKFIYNVASPDEARKRMAVRLRGRSLWLVLFMDAIVSEIISRSGATEANILWNTGGNFLLMLPNNEKNRSIIEEIRANVNKKLFDEYRGVIFLSMDFFESNDLDTDKIIDKLTKSTGQQKKQKFLDILSEQQEFEFGEVKNVKDYCIVCGNTRENANEKDGKCVPCLNHEEIGRKAANARYLVKMENGHKALLNFNHYSLNFSYDLWKKGEFKEENLNPSDFVYRLNDTDFLRSNSKAAQGFDFFGNTVPFLSKRDIDIVLSFDEISQMSKGAQKIGLLKADVDNLGKIFIFGLKDKSIAKVLMLSQMIEIFFSGYLNKICEQFFLYTQLCEECKTKVTKENEENKKKAPEENVLKIKIHDIEQEEKFYRAEKVCGNCEKYKIPSVYINYSGGDDLLLIGPYDDIIKLSLEIRQKFKDFTCNNPSTDISAGVSVVDEKYPITRSVKLASRNLDNSKSFDGKGRITLFEESLKWSDGSKYQEKDLKEILDFGAKMERDIVDKAISKNFVYALLHLWNKTFMSGNGIKNTRQEKRRIMDIELRKSRKMYMPYLHYLVARNVKEGYIESYLKELKDLFPWVRLSVFWVSLRLR